jgi:tetratricopeptide (TPR) repeat protein
MKKTKLSFLYFFILFSCLNFNKIQAQQEKDSLWYHYNLFSKAKGSSDLIIAYKFYKKHKEASLKNNDTLSAIRDLRYIASILKKLGVLYESEASAIEAIQLLELLKNTPTTNEAKIGLYNHLGILYRTSKDYTKALEYYAKFLNLAKSPKHQNIILNNIAFIYKEQKKYEKAKKIFAKVYENSLNFKDKKQTARSLSNLGFVKSKLNYPDGLSNMQEALKIRKNEKHTPGLVASYLHMSEYYLDRNIKQKALFYANKAFEIGKEQKNISYKLDALALIIDLDNNPKVVSYKRLMDSINLSKLNNENKFASIKYDFTKEKRKAEKAKIELVKSQLSQEKEKLLKTIFFSICIIIFLASMSIYFILKSRHKKEKLIEVYKTETRISKKMHDEVANDVYHVMTKLQSNTNINEDLLDDLEGIYIKTRDISKENSILDVNEDFNELLKDLLLSYKSNTINVITKNISIIDWQKISSEKKTTIYRVLQELMTNMKKHSKASLVVLTFNQSNKLIINYIDNGIGSEIKKHNGLQNAENRIKSINSTITFESQITKGFKVKITI